jgi:hypothetical protein
MLLPGGHLHRRVVLRRHRHIIEDMYQKEARGTNGRPSTPPKKRVDGRRRGSPGSAMFGTRNTASGSSDSDSRGANGNSMADYGTSSSNNRDGDGTSGPRTPRDRGDADRAYGVYHYSPTGVSANSGNRATPGNIAGHIRHRQGVTTSPIVGSTFSSLGRPFSLENGFEEAQGGLDESLGNYFQHSSANNTPMASPRGKISTPGASPRQPSLPNSPRENGVHSSGARSTAGSRWSLPRSHDWQEKLSITSGAPGAAGTSSKKERGTYSPSSTVQTARPFDKNNVVPAGSIPPAGTGSLMGLPLGGANFDGLVHICMPQIVASPGKPPRPSSVANQSPRQQINSRSSAALSRTGSEQNTPRVARPPLAEKGNVSDAGHQTAPGEWAF